METSDLPNTDFKTMVIRILKECKERMDKASESLKRQKH